MKPPPTPAAALVLLLKAACQRAPAPAAHASHPATVAHAVKESELTTVTLTPRAVERLGVTTAPVLRHAGAHVLPSESVFYALLRDVRHPFFKTYTQLVKSHG